MSFLRQLPQSVGLLFLLLAAAGCAPARLTLAVNPPVVRAIADRLEGAMPDTENYTERDAPFYDGTHSSGARSAAGELVAVSYNLRYGEAVSETIDIFRTFEPLNQADVILLQEMDAPGVEELAAALELNYVYYPASVAEDGDDFGNAILSPWPLEQPAKIILPGLHPLTGQQRTATRAVARIDGRDVLVYSTHIETATAPASLRLAQMAAVLEDVPDDAGAVIIGGDFNTITGRGVDGLAARYAMEGLTHATPDVGPTVTRFGLRPSAADHLFARGFAATAAGVRHDAVASDHFPVWARLRWGQAEGVGE